MKTLIFSDTHFCEFDSKRFELLKKIIFPVERVIINGDFWEKDKISFDDFCQNRKPFFEILKSKNTIYIFGNHDPKDLVDSKANLFSDNQVWNYKFFQDGIEYYVEHGHTESKKNWKKMIRLKLPKNFRFFLKGFLTKIFLKLKIYKKIISKKPKKLLKIQDFQHQNSKKFWFVFSDIHRGFVDNENKIANTGFIDNGYFSYILIDGKKLHFVEGNY